MFSWSNTSDTNSLIEAKNSFLGDISELNSSKLNRSDTVDTIDEFRIDVFNRLNEFCNEYVDAFSATKINESNEEEENINEYYALVFKKSLPAPLEKLVCYQSLKGKNLQQMETFGITQLSSLNNEENLVAIFPKIRGISIKKIIKNGTDFNETFVIENILKPLSEVLFRIHSQNLVHGCINLDSIYINDKKEVILSEFVSNLNGHNQNPLFETLERFQCDMFGKGPGNSKIDFYALGITIFYMLAKKISS